MNRPCESHENLTWAGFAKMVERWEQLPKPKLYYATSEFLPRGEIFYLEEGDFHPEYIICHPDDFETARVEIAQHFTLVPLKDYRPERKLLSPFERTVETNKMVMRKR